MGALGENSLYLFVAGEPDTGMRPFKDIQSPFVRMFFGTGLPSFRKKVEKESANDVLPGLSATNAELTNLCLPADQIRCVRDVARIAHEKGVLVTVVDVNQQDQDQALIERWVGSNDVLPVLTRPDGAKLVGAEQFGPGQLRKFILRK